MSPCRSELELFRALGAEDDPRNLAEFRNRLGRCVHWVLRRMAKGHTVAGEADDIVADALLRLEQLRERGFSGGEREFRSYLYKVVVSACVEALNHTRWEMSLDAPVTWQDGEETPLAMVAKGMVDPLLSAEATLAGEEEGERLRQALERLDPRCRDLLRRVSIEGGPIRGFAQGTPRNTGEGGLRPWRRPVFAHILSPFVGGGGARWGAQVEKKAGPPPGGPRKNFTAPGGQKH